MRTKQYFTSIDLLKQISEYSYRMLITENWFINFDESNSPNYSSYYLKILQEDLNEFCNYINIHQQIETYTNHTPKLDDFVDDIVWMADVEVMVVRSFEHVSQAIDHNYNKMIENDNIFLPAKAGDNHESHNHNDVSNFVLFQNGHSVVIDIGVGTDTCNSF